MLDCGCGIGGPLCATARSNPPHLAPRAAAPTHTRANLRRSRNIGKFTGSSVIGVTLNQYQVDRGNALCKKAGLDKCKLVKVRPPSTARHSSPHLATSRHSSPQLATARHSSPQLATARHSSPQLAIARHSAAALRRACIGSGERLLTERRRGRRSRLALAPPCGVVVAPLRSDLTIASAPVPASHACAYACACACACASCACALCRRTSTRCHSRTTPSTTATRSRPAATRPTGAPPSGKQPPRGFGPFGLTSSHTRRQRQIRLRAASSLGQPRRIGRSLLAVGAMSAGYHP